MEKKIVHWCIIVPEKLDTLLKKGVTLGTYSTKSDLVRDAVRIKLKEMGLRESCK
jgi:Arc/MetJ-type ribon-helix-helix transcriptional regulator